MCRLLSLSEANRVEAAASETKIALGFPPNKATEKEISSAGVQWWPRVMELCGSNSIKEERSEPGGFSSEATLASMKITREDRAIFSANSGIS